MINEQHEEHELEESNDHERLLTDQNSSIESPPKDLAALTTGQQETDSQLEKESINDCNVFQGSRDILNSFVVNSNVKEIRDIVHTIAKAVFRVIDNNLIDQLANRSSNTLGMRVKDSLILKVQQTNRKEIPFDELKTSLVCRLIVDDDLQIRFLPRTKSPARSSDSENLSTKQKKSVSLAEEVKVFNRVENEFSYQNEVDFSNELMDTENYGITNHEMLPANDDEMYDFTSQKTSASPTGSESSFSIKYNTTETTEKSASFSQDQNIQFHKTASEDVQRSELRTSSKDRKKCENSGKNPMILSNTRLIKDEDEILQKTQTNDYFTRDRVLGERNLSISSSPNENQLLVSLAETTRHGDTSKMNKNLVSKNEKATHELEKEESNKHNPQKLNERTENEQMELTEHGKERIGKRSKTMNEDNGESLVYTKEQIEQMDPTASTTKPLILNVDIKIKFKEEQSLERSPGKSKSDKTKISHNLHEDNLSDGFDKDSSASNILKADEIVRKKSSTKNASSRQSHGNTKSSTETLNVADKTVSEKSSEEKKKSKQIKKWINEFVYSHKKTTRDKSKAENQPRLDSRLIQSFQKSKQQSSTTIAVVEMDITSAKLDRGQPVLESNNEDKISEKGILNGNPSVEKSLNDEDTLSPEAQFNFKRSSDADQKINDSEIWKDKEPSEGLSKSKCVDKDESVGNENVKSSKYNGEKGIHKLFKKTFSTANVESGNLVQLPITSQVQKHTNKNKNVVDVTVIQDTDSNGTEYRTQTNQGKGIINEKDNSNAHIANFDTENNPESQSTHRTSVEKQQSTNKNISLENNFTESSSDEKVINHGVIEATENEEIVISSEKRSSLFSRIFKSKNRSNGNIASEESTVDDDTKIEKKDSKPSKINNQFLAGFERLTCRENSATDLGDSAETSLTCEVSEMDELRRENSRTLTKIKTQQLGELTQSDEKLKLKLLFDTKTNNPTNCAVSRKTSSKVSLKANKLSKKSSVTKNSAHQQSTNDPSSKQTSSKVYQKASKSSGNLSRTDISDIITPGPNNPAAESLLISSLDRNVQNQTDNLHGAATSASEDELELTKKLKTKKKSESSLKRLKVQVFPVAAENILQLDLLSSVQTTVDTKRSQYQNVTNEIDKLELKTNRSRWSLLSKKSSTNLKRDKQEISERECLENATENLTEEPIRRKKSMLNVASKFSMEGDDVIRDNSQLENDRVVADNNSSKSFLNIKSSKVRNKSEDTLIALQLQEEPVNTSVDQSDDVMEPSIDNKKCNKFMKSLKRNLLSNRTRSKTFDGKSEAKLKVSSESQTDMDEESTSESLIESRGEDDIEKSTRSSQLLETKFSQSSTMIKENIFIGDKEEDGSVSLTDDENSYPKQKSRSFKRFFKQSTERGSKIGEITILVEGVNQKSISEVSKQLANDPPKDIMEVDSVTAESDSKKNHSSICEITDLSSSLDYSQYLRDRNSCNINESDEKSITNKLELVPKSSKDLKFEPVQTEKSNLSLKVKKSFARLLQRMSSTNSSEEKSKKYLNDDEPLESKESMNEFNNEGEEKSSKILKSVQKQSSEEIKVSEENTVNGVDGISRKSKTDSKSGTDKTTIQNSPTVFTEKSESVVAYLVKPSLQDQPEGQIITGNKVQSDSTLIKNEPSEEQSHDSIRRDDEKHSLLSNIKSIFKSSNKSDPQKRSIASIEDPENTDVINKSLHSLEINKLGASASEIEVDEERGVNFMTKSPEIPTIQSMKSLQDNRKRSKNRRKSGHKPFGDEATSSVTENIVKESYQATIQSDFMHTQNDDKTKDSGVDDRANNSEESVAQSNLQILLTDEEEADEKTAKVSDRRKKSKKKQNPEVNTKKFAISLSRIFSSSSRKRNGVKESTNPEDHFEITRIPLSSSDDSNTEENDCKFRKKISDMTEENREELVAIKSLDSMHDSDNHTANRDSIVKRSSKILEPKYATNTSNDQLLAPEKSGTVLFSAPIEGNEMFFENELTKKDLFKNVRKVGKPSEKIYAAKGTIVSYAPMVESAKYISDERDDRSEEDDQPEERRKRSSGKNFATIRKLFSRSSMKVRQDHADMEEHSIHQVDYEARKESSSTGTSSIIKHRKHKENSIDQLNDEGKQESTVSGKNSTVKSIKDVQDENEERESYPEIKKQLSRSKVKIRQPRDTDNIEGPVIHDQVLLLNNVAMNQSEFPNMQTDENRTNDCENGSKLAAMKSNEVNIVGDKVGSNHGGIKPAETVEHVVVDEMVIPPVSQMDLNNSIDVEQKLSRRSSDVKQISLLSTAKNYIRRRTEIEKEETEGVTRRADENSRDEDSMTLSVEESKKTLEEQGVAKTESAFSRGLKRLFNKRSSVVDSVASENYVEDCADDPRQCLNVQTNPHLSENDGTDVMIETDTCESGESKTKEISNDIHFAVYNANSETKCSANHEENSQRLENKNERDLNDPEKSKSKSTISLLRSIAKKSVDTLSKAASKSNKRSITKKDPEIETSAALVISETHIATSFSTQDNAESETRVNRDKNQSRSKIVTKDFRLNPSFASRRSTIIMMATPDPPREQSRTEDSNSSNQSRDESSNSPTAFYYLLGPSLDEALVDVRVVFQNLINKITGRDR